MYQLHNFMHEPVHFYTVVWGGIYHLEIINHIGQSGTDLLIKVQCHKDRNFKDQNMHNLLSINIFHINKINNVLLWHSLQINIQNLQV